MYKNPNPIEINFNELFKLDQLKFQEVLLRKRDTTEWWTELNDFILNSKVPLSKIESKGNRTRILRTKNGQTTIPVRIYKYQNKYFHHPFQIELIKKVNNDTLEQMIDYWKNGTSIKSTAEKAFQSAFHYTHLVRTIKKNYQIKELKNNEIEPKLK